MRQVHEKWCGRFVKDEGRKGFAFERKQKMEWFKNQGIECTCNRRASDARRARDRGQTFEDNDRRQGKVERRLGESAGIGDRRKCQCVDDERRSFLERRGADVVSVVSMGYDRDSETLEVELDNGKTFQYYKVPAGVFELFQKSPAKSTFLATQIKDRYSWGRI